MRTFIVTLLLLLGTLGLYYLVVPPDAGGIKAGISLQEALSDDSGEFATVTPGRVFEFPRDHGPHHDFKTEWWYFTGNLQDPNGDFYGYQLTLFKVALSSVESPNESAWSSSFLMMGHLGLSDVKNEKFYSLERFSRPSLELAGAKENGEKVWLENWTIERDEGLPGWRLQASAHSKNGELLEFQLTAKEKKAFVLQGENGYSRKGPSPEHASYYVSQTRLATEGNLTIGDDSFQVSGDSWFDHEWSSKALAEGLVGWDWFSLQLEDETELMLYLLRYEDGRLEAASSGSFVDQSGGKTALALSDFKVEAKAKHRCASGTEYPSRWLIEVPSLQLELEVSPRLAEQEMTSGVSYWEGAVQVEGKKQNQPLSGAGFVELTGY